MTTPPSCSTVASITVSFHGTRRTLATHRQKVKPGKQAGNPSPAGQFPIPRLNTNLGIIRMMDQAAEILVPPRPYRHLQRIERKIRTQVISDYKSGIDPAGKRLHI